MSQIYDLQIKVVDQKGECPVGHKIGETFYIKEGKSPTGLCMTALSALIPGISVLIVGASFPWEEDPAVTCRSCQDYKNPVIFEIRRIPKAD
ncbi:MAG: hypothetical protein VR72_08380 [Clostridiaceae bacterium BRH_c20a]|nr:MAG: hypothetical protein VR72_08380 [Clostridiaceae bacterium BRH_c20a]